MRLETERLIIRPWQESDRPVFHRLNREDEIMEFFPFRRTPEQADVVMDKLNSMIAEHGFGFTALERKEEGDCIGFCGLSRTDLEPFFPEGSVEIGWRLLPETWGKGYVTESARRLLAFAFEELKLAEVVSFARSGHAPHLEEPERFASAVAEFAGRVQPAGAIKNPTSSEGSTP